MSKCRNCLLPEAVPGARIDADGLCVHCHQHRSADHEAEQRARVEREADLEAALEACRGQGQYDCLVNLSGGKDSCYLLHKIKREYRLNVLAFTVLGNVGKVAWENIQRTIQQLEVPHVTYTPLRSFYRKLYRFLLKNQEERGAVRTVCYVCGPLYQAYALRLAVEKDIPLILAGYSPGQPDPEDLLYELAREKICQTDWTPPEIRDSGQFTEEELRNFWNPFQYPPDTRFPRFLVPFHAWQYDQAAVMKAVVKLGLISSGRRASPVVTNCSLNWLLMYSDLRHFGYNPYVPEFSTLIREGKASRWYWRIMGPIVNFMIRRQILLGREVKKSLDWLGLRPQELRITRPAPADQQGHSETGDGARDDLARDVRAGQTSPARGLPVVPVQGSPVQGIDVASHSQS